MGVKRKKISIKWKNPTKWMMFGLVMGVILATVGSVAALNGWFGGGGSISEDTMTRGLVSYWGLDEGSGRVAHDASNYANNGVASSTWTTGKVGGAGKFDGVDDYVDLPSTASLYPTQFTISSWVNTNTLTAGDGNLGQIIFSNYEGLKNFIFYISNTGLVCIRPHDGITALGLCSSSALTISSWYFISATFDGTDLIVYINGENKGSRTATNSANQNDYAAIGMAHAAGGYYFNGLIDEVRIYNRALSAEEMRYHYNRGGPVAHWKFDESGGRTAYDSTDNNNDGTLVLAGSATSSAWVAGKYGSAPR